MNVHANQQVAHKRAAAGSRARANLDPPISKLGGMPFLQFKGKTAVESYHRVVPHHALDIDAKLSLGKDPSLDSNLIIEGDNLIALKSLLPTHAGRIKCVYIDPPYNTGNEGWIYNDNLTQPLFKEWLGKVVGKEGEDATRHDKWCCMMWPRLQLLKELLRDDGAIFISIDDNEVHHLRALMDEIFGEQNFVATIIWEKVYSPKSSAQHFSENHDYVVVYARKKDLWKRRLLPRTAEQNDRYSNPDKDPRGDWKPDNLTARNFYSKGTYEIECPSGRLIKGPPEGRYWAFSEDTFWELDADGRIWWGEDGDNDPAIKRFLSEVKDLVPETIWTYREAGHTQEAKKEVLQILGSTEAPITPKPVALLERILQVATEPGDIVLDSFAGTGTTAHAVLKANTGSDAVRRFVLIQQPHDTKADGDEKRNLCATLTAERVRRVVNGYAFVKRGSKGKTKKMKEPGLGGEFAYVRVGRNMFDEYRDLGDTPPSYEQMARYIWFTETSRNFDPKTVDQKSWRIGTWQDTSYYLLYRRGRETPPALDADFLRSLKDKSARKVIYCEKLWVHRDELRAFGDIRPMLIPFQLK
ncbi:MAG: site-specific DNA-methyltransferase [Planctomycetota bacterium]